jgi:ribonuclease BN (tRNA processing enzyme)
MNLRVTVLGACGAWPAAGDACSCFLVEAAGFRLLLDLGYATLPRLLARMEAAEVDAVFVTHGHPDHCADLNPLLRARAMADKPVRPLPVYAPPHALDAVLALDRPGMLDDAIAPHDVEPGELTIGPFHARTALLPHYRPNLGIRLAAGGRSLAYTGDCGPHPDLVELARGVGLLIAEATHLDVPADSVGQLSSPGDAGRQAAEAGVGRLWLTHLWPGADPEAWRAAATEAYPGPVDVATGGLTVEP